MTSKVIGARVKCAASGVVGQIVARTEWAWRTPEVAVVRDGCDADGKPWDLLWLDDGRVNVCDEEGSIRWDGHRPHIALLARLSDEADLCRNDGANDIAALLDEAHSALGGKA